MEAAEPGEHVVSALGSVHVHQVREHLPQGSVRTGSRRSPHLRQRTCRTDASLVDDGEPGAERLGHLENMAREEDGHAPLGGSPEHVVDGA